MRAGLSLLSLNRGVVSPLALARMDVKRAAMAAETQTNWMARVLGPMALRVGWKYLGASYTNLAARYLKFIFATNDTALLEMTNLLMRVWISDTLLTRPAVTTTITNGTWPANLTGWTDNDEAGSSSTWDASGPYMSLLGSGSAYAIRDQQVTVAGGNVSVEHGIRVVVARGPVILRLGSTLGGDEYLSEATLGTGTHSLSIVPTGDFYIRFKSQLSRIVLVSSCTIEAAGVMTIATPFQASDLNKIRIDQSGDVIYIACAGHQQRMVQRRGTRPGGRSWSIVTYAVEDGPFNLENTSPTTLAASSINGNITVTASAPLFRSTHVGALFSITSVGQVVQKLGSATNDATASIRVTGIGSARTFAISITSDATGSQVDLQRSYDNATWSNVGGVYSWTADAATSYTDGLENQIVYYRLFLTARVAPDVVVMAMSIGSGSVRGVVRLTAFASSTSVSAEVLTALGGTGATVSWQEGNWSDKAGWPTAVRLHEGRLWWSGLNGIWGSISDAFDSFDETYVGSAGPINRTIGSGPVDTINWLLSLKGLMLGAQGTEYAVRASSLDEPLTPTNFNVKGASTQGSGGVDAVKVDQGGYFVNRSAVKIFNLAFSLQDYDYTAKDMMELYPDLGQPGIVRMDVQRLPDTRLHCVRSDGTVIVAVIDKGEDALAWIPITTSGFVEDVVTLPALDGDTDDQVYYLVRRTINGSTVRYLEKWAQEGDCQGAALNCLADAYVTYSGVATATITGLSHLEGAQVVVWADSADVGTDDSARPWTQRYTVAGGQITLAVAASNVVVGLGYTSQFKSSKLGLTGQGVVPQNRQKRIDHLGLITVNTLPGALKFGPTLDDTGSLRMDDMPKIEQGTSAGTAVVSAYDENMIEFPGTWTTDMRICMQAQAPRPATVLAITLQVVQT